MSPIMLSSASRQILRYCKVTWLVTGFVMCTQTQSVHNNNLATEAFCCFSFVSLFYFVKSRTARDLQRFTEAEGLPL